MIRIFQRAALALVLCTLAAPLAIAKDAPKGKPAAAKTTPKGEKSKNGDGAVGPGKLTQLGTFGEWGAFRATGKNKTCYALAEPTERAPASLKRDKAYVFIAARPDESVRNEVSIMMGFAMTDAKHPTAKTDPSADIGGTSFDLIAKGSNAWLKNAAREDQFVEDLKKGAKLVVHATSLKGNSSTDTYSLVGVGDALARMRKECP